jgi:hypothetical protein
VCFIVASDARERSGLPGSNGGPADAFRHCVWSCCMAQHMSEADAQKIGDVHEACLNPNPPGDEAMDQANNAVGRGLRGSPLGCYDACMQALREGSLQTSAEGIPPPRTAYSGK